jgi:serine/threonine-protein kinase
MDDLKRDCFGRYEILGELGRGAMGVVYKARDPKINRVVAVKTISLAGQPPEDEREFRERFYREAEAAGRLSHPGIVTIFDVGEEPETRAPYIVMELVDGPTLANLLAEGDHAMPLDKALQLTLELAEALDCAHSLGVVHRDLKPANILITQDGHAKIADFGVAKLNLANLTLAGRTVGTPAYMSPEQLSGGKVDGRSDLFSLGVMLYTMLTGYRPFQGNSAFTVSFKVVNREPIPVTVLDADLPPGLDILLARAMAKDPTKRYQRGSEMACDIRELLQGRTVTEVVSQVAEIAAQTAGIRGTRSAGGRGTKAVQSNAQPTTAAASKAAQKKLTKTMDMSLVAAVILSGVLLAGIGLSYALRHKTRSSVAAPAVLTPAAIPAKTASTEAAPPATAANATLPTTTAAIPSMDSTSTPAPESAPATVAGETKPAVHITPRAVATLKTMSLQHAQITAAVAPKAAVASAPAPPPAPPATLEIEVNHKFSQAHLSIWVDDQLAYTHKLEGTDKKQMVVFHHVQGHEFHAMQIAAGKHQVKVQVASEAESYDQSGTIEGEFASGKEALLQITFGKKNEIELSLQ